MNNLKPTEETTVGETLRLTGKISGIILDSGYMTVAVPWADSHRPLEVGLPVTIEITLPDPPMPRCPLCGVTEGVFCSGATPGIYMNCRKCNWAITGPTKPTKAEAIAAFREIVREPK